MPAPDPIVTTSQGAYRGVRDGRVDVWKGIRYGAAPVGDLRWRRARPEQPHAGVIDALEFGPVCPQHRDPAIPLGPGVRMDDDCLFLNVSAPAGAYRRTGSRPVMVWLHGGAYVFGSGSQPLYDATRLVVDGDVVVVTLNYRLGALGFADFGSVAPDDARFESNSALSDVLLALHWVRENIAAFGGDPGNVTVFGESAGGGLVTTLLTMPAATGLFHQAIAQSSPATSVYDRTRAAAVCDRILGVLDLTRDDVARLAELPTDTIVDAAMAVYAQVPETNPGTIAFAPVVDGDLVPRHPLDVFRAGESLPVPLLIGTNRDEASVFKLMRSPIVPIAPAKIHEMFAAIAEEVPDIPLPDRERVEEVYAGLAPDAAGIGVAGDVAFRMPTLWLAVAHARRAPVFLYRFDFAPRLLRLLRIGAGHATELPYVWGNFPTALRRVLFLLGGGEAGMALSERMRRRWTRFARAGDPSTRDLPWPPFTDSCRQTLLIDDEDCIVDDPDRELRAAWGDDVLGFR
ncbi:carboxylesterase/lipase family protein [Gordonia sinesedis]